ncbi:uncharacterized protein LOC114942512 [Nylanderia fulva]|uniref:uncharacterized protein LOC114942512 n=1 Tax=Nylanderia fulva TaxID=613905 RepID=UPI0010FBA101|nr:uncharacterized protein LOC114942512 [Nylanderia fulva]
MAERSCGLGIVAEPYRVPSKNWVQSTDGLAAITRRNTPDSPPLNLIGAHKGIVTASWGPIIVISVYLPPSLKNEDFGGRLRILEREIARHHPKPVIIAGDFNAKSTAWGSPRTDWRGNEVEEWAAQCDLVLLNEGSVQTCVRWQGGSIVDLTWMTRPAARMAQRWRVAAEVETLSDHKYIEISVAMTTKEVAERRRIREANFRRWALRKLDEDMLMAALIAAMITKEEGTGNLEEHKACLTNVVLQACDAAMPRVKTRSPKHAYWWSEDIAELRRSSDHARRNVKRKAKHALLDPEGLEDAWDAYKERRNALRASIR